MVEPATQPWHKPASSQAFDASEDTNNWPSEASPPGRSDQDGSSEQGKMCLICKAQSTPMWRNGPAGPKTLCNACGVRLQRQQHKARQAPPCSARLAGLGGGYCLPQSRRSCNGPDQHQSALGTLFQSWPVAAAAGRLVQFISGQGPHSIGWPEDLHASGALPLASLAGAGGLQGLQVVPQHQPAGLTTEGNRLVMKRKLPPSPELQHDTQVRRCASPTSSASGSYSEGRRHSQPSPNGFAAAAPPPGSRVLLAPSGSFQFVEISDPSQAVSRPPPAEDASVLRVGGGQHLMLEEPMRSAAKGSNGRVEVRDCDLILHAGGQDKPERRFTDVRAVVEPARYLTEPAAAAGAKAGGKQLVVYSCNGERLAAASEVDAELNVRYSLDAEALVWDSGWGWSLVFERHEQFLVFKGMLQTMVQSQQEQTTTKSTEHPRVCHSLPARLHGVAGPEFGMGQASQRSSMELSQSGRSASDTCMRAAHSFHRQRSLPTRRPSKRYVLRNHRTAGMSHGSTGSRLSPVLQQQEERLAEQLPQMPSRSNASMPCSTPSGCSSHLTRSSPSMSVMSCEGTPSAPPADHAAAAVVPVSEPNPCPGFRWHLERSSGTSKVPATNRHARPERPAGTGEARPATAPAAAPAPVGGQAAMGQAGCPLGGNHDAQELGRLWSEMQAGPDPLLHNTMEGLDELLAEGAASEKSSPLFADCPMPILLQTINSSLGSNQLESSGSGKLSSLVSSTFASSGSGTLPSLVGSALNTSFNASFRSSFSSRSSHSFSGSLSALPFGQAPPCASPCPTAQHQQQQKQRQQMLPCAQAQSQQPPPAAQEQNPCGRPPQQPNPFAFPEKRACQGSCPYPAGLTSETAQPCSSWATSSAPPFLRGPAKDRPPGDQAPAPGEDDCAGGLIWGGDAAHGTHSDGDDPLGGLFL